MRVLFTSTPGLGHVHPLLPLMRAARERGDDVQVAVSADARSAVSGFGFDTVTTPEPSPAETEAFWSRLREYPEPDTAVIGTWFGRMRTRAVLARTRQAVEDFEPDLVVSEAAEFAGLLTAELHGIPHVMVGITATGMTGFTPGLLVDELNLTRRELGLDETDVVPWRRYTRFATAVPRVLWGGPDDAPADALLHRHEDPEGVVPAVVRRPPAPGRRPRVYATLGSVAGGVDFAKGAYGGVLAALGHVDADVLFTTGKLDPAELGPVPANVKVERYVPQHVAMACEAVVTHGGCGTTVAALARGLPLVAVPLFADQPHNAARVQAAGAGIAVDAAQAVSALPAAVDRVLTDPSYAENARRIAADIAALPSAAQALAQVAPAAVH